MRARLTAIAVVLAALLLPAAAGAATPAGQRPLQAQQADMAGRAALPAGASAGDKASPDEAARYAQREAAAPELAAFQGGGAGIYIGGSTLAIVLLIIILIIIL